jgi:hypothetical protein
MSVMNLTPDDAKARFWELNNHVAHPDVSMEAIYCNGKLKMILEHSYTDAVPNGQHQDAPQ